MQGSCSGPRVWGRYKILAWGSHIAAELSPVQSGSQATVAAILIVVLLIAVICTRLSTAFSRPVSGKSKRKGAMPVMNTRRREWSGATLQVIANVQASIAGTVALG